VVIVPLKMYSVGWEWFS